MRTIFPLFLLPTCLLAGCSSDDPIEPARCDGPPSEDCWKSLGLNEWILSVEATPRGLYAGTSHSGVLRHRWATSWTSIGLEDVRIETLFYYTSEDDLLAGVADTIGYPTEHDIYAWTGSAWEPRDAQPDEQAEYRSGAYELAGAGDTLFWGAITPNIFRSVDGGREWHLISGIEDAFGGPMTDIDVSDSNPSIIRATGNTAGMKAVYIESEDGGATCNSGYIIPIAASREDAVFDLAADPLVEGRLWAATSAGIVRSDDGGASWTVVAHGPTRALVLKADRYLAFAIEAGATPDGELRLLESTDAGETWTEVPLAMPVPAVTAVTPTAGNAILVGTVQGVWLFAPHTN